MTIKQLEQGLEAVDAEIAELQDRLERMRELSAEFKAELNKSEPDWPQVNDRYWHVNERAEVESYRWANDETDRGLSALGNVFRTPQEAEAHRLRLQAMAKRWLPEMDDEYWTYHLTQGYAYQSNWTPRNNSFDRLVYFLGNVHKTEAEAEAWGKQFGSAFMLPEGEK